MDTMKILKRAWYILWNYRTLWVFGFLLALTVGGASFGNHQDRRAGRVPCPPRGRDKDSHGQRPARQTGAGRWESNIHGPEAGRSLRERSRVRRQE